MPDRLEPSAEEHPQEMPRERWCAGLRHAGVRPLDADERAGVRRVRTVLGWQIAAFAIALISVLIAGLALFVGGPLPGRRFGAWALFFVAMPALGAAAFRLANRRAQLGLDLARGEVERFEGTIGAHERLDRVQRSLVARALLTVQPTVLQTLEVLPTSRRVLRANEVPAPGWNEAPVSVVASPPAYAFRAPLPPGFGEARGGADFEFLRRSLNAGELDEIRRSARLLRLPGLAQVTQAACFAAALALTLITNRLVGSLAGSGPLFLLWAAGVSLATLAYLERLRVSRALERDTGLGWAITVRPKEGVETAEADAGSATEFLPHSLMLWTESGKPARWRRRVVTR